jgi:hypothetical protein
MRKFILGITLIITLVVASLFSSGVVLADTPSPVKDVILVDGKLVLEFVNGGHDHTGIEIGKDGHDGAPGIPGTPGLNGTNGVGVSTTSIDTNGNLIVTLTDETVFNLGCVVGTDGIDGATGATGASGQTIIGPQGLQGSGGPEGPQGPQGPIGPIGPQGLQGDTIRGPIGVTGAAGATFLTSAVEPTFAVGKPGDLCLEANGTVWVKEVTGWKTFTLVVGPQGIAGKDASVKAVQTAVVDSSTGWLWGMGGLLVLSLGLSMVAIFKKK